jgi:hypothetical protein
MSKIRNDRQVAVILPTQHLAADVGEEIPWPDHLPVPDGFSPVADEPTKAELLARARQLGLDVDGRTSKDAIAAAVAAHEAASPDEDHLSPED